MDSITVPVVTLEIKSVMLSDTQPASPEGYEAVLVKDLGFTKMWMVFHVIP